MRYRRLHAVDRRVAGETLIVPVRRNVGDLMSIYSVNAAGAMIWEMLREARSVADLASAVTGRFEVPAEQAEHDVAEFLHELCEKKMVESIA